MVERPQLEALNGLRGIAAIAVVLFHMASALKMNLAPSGYLAVDFFFVLSGFVISRAYEPRLGKGLGMGAFMWKRAVRFYPLYLLGALLGLASLALNVVMFPPAPLTAQELATSTVFALAYLPSPATLSLFPLNVPAWSLFFELAVNGLFAALLWRMSGRALGAVAAVVFVVIAMQVFGKGDVNGGANWSDFGMGLARTVFAFALGMILARFGNQPRFGVVTAAGLSVALAVLLCLPVPASLRPFYDLAFIAVLSPAIIYTAAQIRATRADPALRWLGLISFPLYAIHYPLTDLLRSLSHYANGAVLAVGLMILLLIGSTVIGQLELTFQKWAKTRSLPARQT